MAVTISFCTTCRDRAEHLARTLPTNAALLGEGEELVILDYGSETPIGPLVRESPRPGIESFRLPRTPLYRSSHAKNVAHRCATGDFLVNLDADNLLTADYLSWLRGTVRESGPCLVFTEAWGGGGGRIGVSRGVFVTLGGYDERIDGWGYDDNDLVERARGLGCKLVKTPRKLMRFIRHDDGLRSANPQATRSHGQGLSEAAIQRGEFVANAGSGWGAAPGLVHERLL